jgi:hypothetical protein
MIADNQSNQLEPEPIEDHLSSDVSSGITTTSGSSVIEVGVLKRYIPYTPVTEAEVEFYAQYSWWSTIFFTLFGAFFGVAAGSLIALVQGSNPETAPVILTWIAILSGVAGGIFFVCAVTMTTLKNKNKPWKSTS